MTGHFHSDRRAPRPAETVVALLTALLFFGLYLARLTPGTGWYDNAEFIGVATTFGIAHPTGYPLYALMGRLVVMLLAPLGDPALRVNLLSALAAAATLGLMVPLTGRLTALLRPGPIPRPLLLTVSILPAAMLGALPLFVEQAITAEVYTLHTLAAVLVLLLGIEAVRRAERPIPFEVESAVAGVAGESRWGPGGGRLALLVFYLVGVGMSNHATLVLYLPALLFLIYWMLFPQVYVPEPYRAGRRWLPMVMLALAGAGALGLSLYLIVVLRAGVDPPFNWGRAVTAPRMLDLLTAAEARDRPAQFFPVTPLNIWVRMAAGMSWPLLSVALAGWVAAALRRPRLGLFALLWLLVPLAFLLLGLDIQEDSFLPLHLLVALGAALAVIQAAEWAVVRWGPAVGSWSAFGVLAALLVAGPLRLTVMRWDDLKPPVGPGGAGAYLDAITASAAGIPNPEGEVRGLVFAEDNTTAFLLWNQVRLQRRHPRLHGIYLVLAREEWYQEELRQRVPGLQVPEWDSQLRHLPHQAAGSLLMYANRSSELPRFLSAIILPEDDRIYGAAVPQGVLLRLEEPGYQATEEDVTRHLELMRAYAPAAADTMPRLDTLSRDWWSGRHQVVGEAWARLGVAGAAEVEFRAATRLNPQRVQTWVALGTFYGTLGNWPAAEAAWRRALEQRPREAFFRFHLAKTLVPQGKHAEAEEWLPPRPPADVEEADFLLLRAAVHLNLERPAQAEADVLEAIERNPQSARAHNDLGVVRMRRGDPLAARASFLKAVDIDSTMAEAWANAGSLAFQDGEYERASDYLARAIEAGTFNPQVGYLLGVARMRTGNLSDAEQVLRRNRALWPRHPDTYITLGLVLEAAGRRQEAESIYEAGRMAMPDDPRFAQQLRRLRAIPPE